MAVIIRICHTIQTVFFYGHFSRNSKENELRTPERIKKNEEFLPETTVVTVYKTMTMMQL